MVGFFDLVGTAIPPVSKKLAVKANRSENMSGGMCLTSRRISFSVRQVYTIY